MFKIENGPHIRDNDTTSKIMTRLIIALVPIICFAIFKNTILVYYYSSATFLDSLHPVFMILVSIITSYISELLWFKFVLKNTLSNCFKEIYKSNTIIPGLLLALVLPVNTPLYLVAIGAFSASIIGKMLFGGFGQNIFNPALIGYLIISVGYSAIMGGYLNAFEIDTIAGSTPLTNLATANYFAGYDTIVTPYGNLFNFLFGSIPGAIGEVSKILIVVAFIYLTITKTIKWKIPVFYVGTVFILTLILGLIFDQGLWYPLFHILSGGLLFGAVFMATDPVTSPITPIGQVLYGISLGVLTVVLRFLTPYPEGVLTSILFMNMTVSLFDKVGIMIKESFKKKLIYIICFIILAVSMSFVIHANINKEDKSSITIINIDKIGDNYIYEVSAKGWGLITAKVTINNGIVTTIDILNSSAETKWSAIEREDYINKLMNGQSNLNNVDAVSGVTITSDALKEIIREVIKDNGDSYER